MKSWKEAMVRLRSLVALLIGVLLTMHCAFADDVTPVHGAASLIHVSQEMTSPFLHLVIDADVQPVEIGTRLPTYKTNYPSSTKEAWLEVFFGDPQAEVVDSFAGKSKEALLSNLITDADRERAYSLGEKSTRYQSYFCSLFYTATNRELVRNVFSMVEGAQAEGLALSPEDAIEVAESWIQQLSSNLGWQGFSFAHCYALPRGDSSIVEDPLNYVDTGMYLVEFERYLHDIPVARDVFSFSDVEGDLLQLYIDDSGILCIDGICREYTELNAVTIHISLEKALEILHDQMDFVRAFPDDDNDGFVIREAGLCWRLIPTLTQDNWDYNAVMEARPAWRFASGICRNQTDVFVIYIDAETGEVLE